LIFTGVVTGRPWSDYVSAVMVYSLDRYMFAMRVKREEVKKVKVMSRALLFIIGILILVLCGGGGLHFKHAM
jgi:hypothetical protein